jgi:hypothetical protein
MHIVAFTTKQGHQKLQLFLSTAEPDSNMCYRQYDGMQLLAVVLLMHMTLDASGHTDH